MTRSVAEVRTPRADKPNRWLVLLLVVCAHGAAFHWLMNAAPVDFLAPGTAQVLQVSWFDGTGSSSQTGGAGTDAAAEPTRPPVSKPDPGKAENPWRAAAAKSSARAATKSKAMPQPPASASPSVTDGVASGTSAAGEPARTGAGSDTEGAGATAQGAGSAGEQGYSAPRFDAAYLSNPAPRYPAISREMGEEGRVFLRVQVSAQGNPLEIGVYKSSGYARLDSAAVEAVRRWQFVPGRLGGQPVAARVIVPINFFLE